LRAWVEEKSRGSILAEDVASISIETIRCGGPKQVCNELTQLSSGQVCVINAATGRDLRVFVQGLLQAEATGKRFLYRTAASFAAVRAANEPRPPLSREELNLPPGGGGLVVVGSYVPTSSAQLHDLIAAGTTVNVEVNARAVLTKDSRPSEVGRAVESVNRALQSGRSVVLYTSRELVTGSDSLESLSFCRHVSDALMDVLEGVTIRPRFVVAKGGITSSDVATKALRVKRAVVLGQIVPGIPLWRLGAECRWPELIYVSFPGNLGGPGTLTEVVRKLT
jgi:uncharacterized protein YgbK (DUF1537 family)